MRKMISWLGSWGKSGDSCSLSSFHYLFSISRVFTLLCRIKDSFFNDTPAIGYNMSRMVGTQPYNYHPCQANPISISSFWGLQALLEGL